MAYASRQLTVIGYAYGFTQWHYATEDSLDAVLAHGYFQPASAMLRDGDRLMLNLVDGERVALMQDFAVSCPGGRPRLLPLSLPACPPPPQADSDAQAGRGRRQGLH